MRTRGCWFVLALVAGCGSVTPSSPDASATGDARADSRSIDAPSGQCDATSCSNGCCDSDGTCRAAPACRTTGNACMAGCPLTVPESSNLMLWLVGDDYDAAAATKMWSDRSGRGANASCATLTCPVNAAVNGHRSVAFSGTNTGFALGDPAMAFKTQSFTVFAVAKPSPQAVPYAQFLAFYVNGNYVKLQKHSTTADLAFQVITPTTSNFMLSPTDFGWSGNWERVFASVDSTGAAKVGVYNNASSINSIASGTLVVPANVDYSASYIGTSPINPGTMEPYIGEIAEIIVFDAQLSEATQQAVQSYLTARYGF